MCLINVLISPCRMATPQEKEQFSPDVLGHPLLTVSNTDLSLKISCAIDKLTDVMMDLSILSSVFSLSLNIRFSLNKPGYTLCLPLRCSHSARVY